MEIKKILAAVALTTLSTSSYATYGYWSNNHNCGGGYTPPDSGGCTVTWDFTNNPSDLLGDPITYDPNNGFGLAIEGFTIVRESGAMEGMIKDSTGEYATDYDGSSYGVGVHATGESEHWGTKIDNLRTDNETWLVRDAVLMDFGSCLVSIDELSLIKAYDDADRDFELWAFSGDLNPKALAGADGLGNYLDWTATAADGDGFTLIGQYGNDNGWWTPQEITEDISTTVESRYYILISGKNQSNNNDAFRIGSLTINCDLGRCITPPDSDGETPIPGTLALLGIGALATRRRFFKLS
ncbi:MAG: hypothetical protein H6960_05135 [Chromatiaceae bacterium]|nr:hypothetical protein [Chromatiaceae bacterium]MCP5439646.1 hypothetical protein [Chromatiaceae bacterium]